MSDINVRPLHDRVIVEVIEETTTAGGIVIPATSGESQPSRGRVVAAGPGKKTDTGIQAMDVKSGDVVLFGKFSGTKVKVREGEELLVMREDDIMAIVEE